MPTPKKPSKPSTDVRADQPIDAAKLPCKIKRVIVIDPGHGGTTDVDGSAANHATSVSKHLEKNLTLEFAKSLEANLKSAAVADLLAAKNCCDLQVFLTRTTDVNVTGSGRVAVATKNKADILISLHFNGGEASIHGTEAFYKARTNRGQSNEAEDKALAQAVNLAIFGAFRAMDPNAKNRGVKPDTETKPKKLAVLSDPGIGLSGKMCRSIIVEVEYITHPPVDVLLVSGPDATKNRDAAMLAVAKALVNGL